MNYFPDAAMYCCNIVGVKTPALLQFLQKYNNSIVKVLQV